MGKGRASACPVLVCCRCFHLAGPAACGLSGRRAAVATLCGIFCVGGMGLQHLKKCLRYFGIVGNVSAVSGVN